jgi:exodeoxyribonuclease VII large subunit
MPARDLFSTTATEGRRIHSPTELARRARLLIEDGLGTVWIEGELSNFRVPASGHWYFTLKDENAQIRAAMFVNRNRLMRLKPREGMQVLVRGKVTLYEARSDFQVIVEHIEEAGEGALRRAYEELLRKLAAEGLTDSARKRPLPRLPHRVAVITSATGAALQDILSVWRRRYPLLEVIVLDVAVQGPAAEPQILAALQNVPALDVDLVIITRGGGSLEDLWAFNLESIARALAACPLPTISAIGHEIDTAITDHVADVRAPTPSAAAELATPHRSELVRELEVRLLQLESVLRRRLQSRGERVRLLTARLVSPMAQLQQWMQRADDLQHRAEMAIRHRFGAARRDLLSLGQSLRHLHPEGRIRTAHERLSILRERLHGRMRLRLQSAGTRIVGLERTLKALSPLNTVARGYTILTDASGNAIIRAAALTTGQTVTARLADGTAALTVDSTSIEG